MKYYSSNTIVLKRRRRHGIVVFVLLAILLLLLLFEGAGGVEDEEQDVKKARGASDNDAAAAATTTTATTETTTTCGAVGNDDDNGSSSSSSSSAAAASASAPSLSDEEPIISKGEEEKEEAGASSSSLLMITSSLATKCATSMGGVHQVLHGWEEYGISLSAIQSIVDGALEYIMMRTKNQEEEEQEEKDATMNCRNEHEMCVLWAAMGECQANAPYMEKMCAPVCHSCGSDHHNTLISVGAAAGGGGGDGAAMLMTKKDHDPCAWDPSDTESSSSNTWQSGDLDRMFRRLSSDPYLSEYNVQIHSSPDDDDLNNNGGPWVITMENVISSEEAARLIELGEREGFQASISSGDKDEEESSSSNNNNHVMKHSRHRTSYNTWCRNDCYTDETARRVMHRLSDLTGIEEVNSEFLQLLRYGPDQYYLPHHDFIPSQVEQPQGPRILTVLMYLNNIIVPQEEGGGSDGGGGGGGETDFPKLGVRVAPKVGRCLIFPNVLNDNPQEMDPRTIHQALKVRGGEGVWKYGANAWFHLRDAKTPNRAGCDRDARNDHHLFFNK